VVLVLTKGHTPASILEYVNRYLVITYVTLFIHSSHIFVKKVVWQFGQTKVF